MAVPKRKVSKQRKHKRAANWKAAVPGLAECPQCHELKLSHRVCGNCGYYDHKEIVKQTADDKK
ncbi:MAG TPA: 50S ribosomal protein L32 [Eubacteriales bacterium]|nr:50S ribosomal protein L32 [Clostridia bacterium]HRX13419.1 50S ribosomal protein L32 [Eubacteriales bacterium]